MADAIARVAQDLVAAAGLARAGTTRASTLYSATTMARGYLDVLRPIVPEAARGAASALIIPRRRSALWRAP